MLSKVPATLISPMSSDLVMGLRILGMSVAGGSESGIKLNMLEVGTSWSEGIRRSQVQILILPENVFISF